MKIKTLLIFMSLMFFVGSLNTSIASDLTCSTLTEEFEYDRNYERLEKLFLLNRNDERFNQERKCHKNIQNFLEVVLLNQNYSWRNLQVLILTKKNDLSFKSINSKFAHSSNREVQRWNYHVVLSYKDKIIDFDYDSKGKIPTVSEYLQKYFISDHYTSNKGVVHRPNWHDITYIPVPITVYNDFLSDRKIFSQSELISITAKRYGRYLLENLNR